MDKNSPGKKSATLTSPLKTGKNKQPDSSVRQAVQKRIHIKNRSSIIPGVDINELKRSLELLKYALDYSEAIVDTVRQPLIVLDKSLNVLTANQAFYDTFKVTPSKTENFSIYEMEDGRWNIPKLRLLLEKILPKNTYFDNFEVELDLPGIGHRNFLLSARRTYRQVNETEAILLAFEDITVRKQLEKQKDDFIGIVSHELKSPLTSISIFSEILQTHLKRKKDEKGEVLLSKIKAQLDRLSGLTASFVDVYKIQTGELKLNKTTFRIGELVAEVVGNFQMVESSHHVINNVVSKRLVYADRERLTQVLINLISNAIKYSPNAGKVEVSLLEEKKGVSIYVKDFGIGISKEEQVKIFDRFYRVKDVTQKKVSGLGLGLYVSEQIVKQHKGKVGIDSQVGKGSTFYFSIPYK